VRVWWGDKNENRIDQWSAGVKRVRPVQLPRWYTFFVYGLSGDYPSPRIPRRVCVRSVAHRGRFTTKHRKKRSSCKSGRREIRTSAIPYSPSCEKFPPRDSAGTCYIYVRLRATVLISTSPANDSERSAITKRFRAVSTAGTQGGVCVCVRGGRKRSSEECQQWTRLYRNRRDRPSGNFGSYISRPADTVRVP